MDKQNLQSRDTPLPIGQQRQVIVEPGDSRAIGLGSYAPDEPEPDFELAYEPDEQDAIGVYPSSLAIDGKYLWTYMFHNYGHKTCTVTVTRVKPGTGQ